MTGEHDSIPFFELCLQSSAHAWMVGCGLVSLQNLICETLVMAFIADCDWHQIERRMAVCTWLRAGTSFLQ